MKSVTYIHSHQIRPLPRGWKILGLAAASWAVMLLAGSGLINLFHMISSAI